ncbi:HEAT repeat domain-containing protein [Leptolyngbya sp. AN03gr2]|uniref:HEAT repeat domain-containing protein n=1 Tax=unclassified Leptolyngbya TaxID=2650499 RepID=UPI003D312696
MVRSQLLIVTCMACLGVLTRPVSAVRFPPVLLAQTAQQARTPFWASPLFLGGLGATSVIGAATVFILKRSSRSTPEVLEPIAPEPIVPLKPPSLSELPSMNGSAAPKPDFSSRNGHTQTETLAQAETLEALLQVVDSPKPATQPKLEETTRLAKVNIVDELIQDLRSPDPVKRRKIIWELGQRGDTRAVQPLVDLLVDSDSKQRSLILSALSEIGTRTLKPMTRALAVSLQDENAEVRKNAIRDLTRVYDMVSQISNLLHKATDDSDKDVQETAKWALGQLNRIRSTPGDSLPALKNSVSPPESLP